ncbi:hypothetical protein E2R51_11185 [Jeotgalibacillus sp. S-D1]|uniref:hypothetical protein n=1 Tax=Jeotgalibacillus sp. S-D1 TaxID=2552189 RepID=UPI00105A0B61|nr:hypothetical protein [Jeotgalibacillus sp. S-D1]TDL31781.1 hypothetical protein E2R51_11185 [Jeotgalibacillus sp. S-D1]
MKKEYAIVILLMGFLGNLGGLFYQQMFHLLDGELHWIITVSLFIGGLMLLNLVIEKIIPLSDYPYTHPLRLVSYLVFIVFVFLAVSIN